MKNIKQQRTTVIALSTVLFISTRFGFHYKVRRYVIYYCVSVRVGDDEATVWYDSSLFLFCPTAIIAGLDLPNCMYTTTTVNSVEVCVTTFNGYYINPFVVWHQPTRRTIVVYT